MTCPCDELFQLYDDMLDLHIKTKTTDTVFHKESLGMYETLFSAFHDTMEAMQDSKQMPGMSGAEARKKAYDIIMKAKSLLEGFVNENKDMAVDNVLRGLVDKLGFQCGAASALLEGKATAPKDTETEDTEDTEAEDTEDADTEDYESEKEPSEGEGSESEDEDEDISEEEKKRRMKDSLTVIAY